MTRIEDSVEINVASEKISQYLLNVDNLPHHLPISDIRILQRSEGVTRFRHKITAAGKTREVIWEMRLPEPNRKIVFKTIGGMKAEGTWLIEPTEKGTKLTATIEYDSPGWVFGFILDKKIEKEMRSIYTESLGRLKRILEGQK